ncbi:Fe-S protein assembly chaperone HscA [Buchnera aphidicola (Melanaphis sacchari)]|uniref:Chaperone protein HscA n=1 Tax=Buchnera aphidicola (Melanaphis sacchari) TaxID=2173854 RepID=A0A2U8DER4_9GAMM|nr:Fe-S protein assembly chaperone HscA [Buchnera aphidicola]AWH90227.1 Fe-S protein assembly chaperone HscA [Buchnera aphidicola (Melanaphis sacchari)]
MISLKEKFDNKLVLGIDFGTTYSLVSSIRNRRITLLKDENKCYLLPSVIYFNKDKFLIGAEAEKKIIEDPTNTIISVKRLIGRSINFIEKQFPNLPYIIHRSEDGGIFFHTNAGIFTPIDIVSKILEYLRRRACYAYDQEIRSTVITVPAYFNNIQRESIKKAAILAQMKLIRLLNEPTSAAIAYGLQEKKQGIIIVYDLGGGTFDVSILKLNQGVFEVLATSGDANLGGDDFDLCLLKYISKKLNLSNENDKFFQSLLLQKSKEIKIKLSQCEKVKIDFFDYHETIHRDEFNAITLHLVQKTLLICSNILKEIDLKKESIQEVIMVGGSTRIPIVYEEVQKFFNKPLLTTINPDQVVAIGAAIHANMLMQNSYYKKTLLLDVVPLSLGIEVMGGVVEKIIFKNTSIPISKTKEFTTFKDNQTAILIHVLQGEQELVQDCISLSRFVLKGIPPQKAGKIRILVTFEIDTDGLINITASEKYTQKEKKIQIDNNIFSI